ncbi:hypothetical protein LINPERHAP2_LOCUS42228 [Linum perenne]
MILGSEGPTCVSGEAVEVAVQAFVLSYFQLNKIGIKDFNYTNVKRMFYLTPSRTMVNRLHHINSDVEVS